MIQNNSLTPNEIYASIQDRIRLGQYKPGEKLSENNLAKEFNCSRTPVREAVKTLEQNGLVVIQPKSGTYVRNYSQEEIKNAIEIRAYLEALAFTLDIEKETDITPLKQCLDKMNEIATAPDFDLMSFGKYHFDFHATLVAISGNDFLIELYDKLHLNALPKIFFSPMTKEALAKTQIEHNKILKYLENKDPAGEQFIIQHLMTRRNNYK